MRNRASYWLDRGFSRASVLKCRLRISKTPPLPSEERPRNGQRSDRNPLMRRVLRASAIGLFALSIVLSAIWANLAIAYQMPGSAAARIGACLVLNLIALAALVAVLRGRRTRWRAVLIYAVAYAIFLGWSSSISASNDRNWAADVAHGITGTVDGGQLSVRNLRNFSWRTEADYTERWEQRTYDLSRLQSLDLFLVYWMGPSIAHTIMSFGFEDGHYLDFSIELRRTQNDQYSAVAGFFKTHELIYIGADERDLMTLRKARHEQIQLYRLRTPPQRARALLVEYIEQANDLDAHPRFYNTLTTNCTSTIFDMMQAVTSSIPFDWRIILTGHLPSYLYEHGAVDTRIALEELRQRADVTSRVDASLSEVEFSSRLREGVPAPR
jgi:hypothetical protein